MKKPCEVCNKPMGLKIKVCSEKCKENGRAKKVVKRLVSHYLGKGQEVDLNFINN